MSKPTLAELRARLKKKNENKGGNFTENNDVYPHWNIDVDATAMVRIIPDANEDNENSFYVDKLEHKLSINGKDRKIACIQMYGEKCPICELSAKYYKSEGKGSVNGKYYYRKKTALLKALILKDPITKDGHENAVGKVKTLQFTYQLMQQINQQLANEEEETALECVPWDVDEGHNFFIKKTKQGEYDNYTTGSGFAHKVTSVPEEYRDAVTEGTVDLSTLLPANPGLEKVQALLEAHLTGSDEAEEDEEEAKPAKRRVVESDDEDVPVKKRKPVVEDEDEEEIPVKKRKPVVEDEDEEEVPVKKRKPVVEEDEDDAPVIKKRKPVVEDEDEEEAPAPKKKKVVVEDEDEEDDEVMRKIRARKKRDASDE